MLCSIYLDTYIHFVYIKWVFIWKLFQDYLETILMISENAKFHLTDNLWHNQILLFIQDLPVCFCTRACQEFG
jgi:hypothetical protein